MTSLLEEALEAHGGLDAWNRYSRLRATVSLGGGIWAIKGQGGLLDDVGFDMQTHDQVVDMAHLSGGRLRSRFSPDVVTLWDADGHVVDRRPHPRKAFAGHFIATPWSALDAVYFSSYALWTYLSCPFLFAQRGVTTREIAAWEEEPGTVWRRLFIEYPDTVATHTRYAVAYFGEDGLLRRYDYLVDIMAGATGANYAFDYVKQDGIMVPTHRVIHAFDGTGHKVATPVLVDIRIKSIRLS